MIKEGFNNLFNQKDLMALGIIELIKKLPRILKIRTQLIKKIEQIKPDIFIGIDLPDFNFSIEKVLIKKNIITIHYVSPSIWAWRPNRVNKIVKINKKILCLFPHEPNIYIKAGGNAIFVGHPLALEYPIIPTDTNKSKQSLQLPHNIPIFTIMPGSREIEIKYMGELFIKTIELILKKYQNAQFIIPTATEQSYLQISKILKSENYKYLPIKLIKNNSKDAINSADVVLVSSGTATLEVALCKKPMVISYKISPITFYIVKKNYLLKFIGLPNILLKKRVSPEIIQNDAIPENLAIELIKLYENKQQIQYLKSEFTHLHKMLKRNTDEIVAKAILEELK